MKTVGQRIRDLRKSKGYTLRQLAPMVGVGFSYLCKVENGRLDSSDSPSESLIHRLAEVLDGDEDELLILSRRVPPSIANRIFEMPEAFRMLAECNDRELETFVKQARKR